jgi:hypothetical protein
VYTVGTNTLEEVCKRIPSSFCSSRHHSYYSYSNNSNCVRLPSLSSYVISRLHLHDDHDHCSQANATPDSTAPSSPIFSLDSPAFGHAPLATPRPSHGSCNLPTICSRSTLHGPALALMDPRTISILSLACVLKAQIGDTNSTSQFRIYALPLYIKTSIGEGRKGVSLKSRPNNKTKIVVSI